MSDIAQIVIIARREFVERARSKVFLTTMAVLGLLIVGGIMLLSFVAGESSAVTIGVGGDSPEGLVTDIEAAAAALEVDAVVTEYSSADAARRAVEDGGADVVMIDGSVIVARDTPSPTLTTILSSAANSAVRREIADMLGLSDEEVAAIVAPVQVTIEELDPEDPEEIARGVASFLAAIVLLTTIMVFGQFVAMGIVEEKQNRVVEVILSRARTTSLLIGKVLGIGVLGLLQIMVLGIAVIVGIVLAPLPDVGVPNLTSIGVTAVIWLVIWFVLGYLEYSFLYATLGATISRQEDMQSVAFIPAILIMPAYFLVTITASTGGEPSTLVRFASFFPLWSPVVMPFRINTGTIEWWEIVLAVGLVILMIVVLVRIGARVYRGAALRTGGKVSLREAWSSAGD